MPSQPDRLMGRCCWSDGGERCAKAGDEYWDKVIRLCAEHGTQAAQLAFQVPSRLYLLPPDPEHSGAVLMTERR